MRSESVTRISVSANSRKVRTSPTESALVAVAPAGRVADWRQLSVGTGAERRRVDDVPAARRSNVTAVAFALPESMQRPNSARILIVVFIYDDFYCLG